MKYLVSYYNENEYTPYLTRIFKSEKEAFEEIWWIRKHCHSIIAMISEYTSTGDDYEI